MTSSISSSEAAAGSDTASAWARWLVAFLSVPLCGISLIVAFLVAIDPYDTGKFGLFDIDGVDDANTRTAIPSRARDRQFDAAVIGNSTVQRLHPAELSRATGLRFVQLYMVGASPHEELAVLESFIRYHPRPGALVIGTDPYWCTHDHADPARNFPYWLYDRSFFEYAVRMVSWQGIEHGFQRLAIGLGLRQRAHADGFENYEEYWHPPFRATNAPRDPLPAASDAERNLFPAISRLDAAIKRLPPDVPVVVIVPPTFHTMVPQPGTPASREQEACNAALERTLAGRRNGKFINYRVDNALTRDPANFADFVHYREIVAVKMSEGIAAGIRLGAAAKIDF